MKQVIDFIRNERSLAFKLILIFFIGFSSVFLIVFLYNYNVSKSLSDKNEKQHVENLALSTASKLDKVLHRAQKSTDYLAHNIQNAEYTPAELTEFLQHFLENTEEIDGAALAFESFYFDDSEEYFASYFYRINGKIESKMIGNTQSDYALKDWYVSPKETGKAVWSETVLDQNGKSTNFPVYSVPLYRFKNGGRSFFGVLSVDISLDYLEDFLNDFGFSESDNSFVVTQNSVINIDSDKKLFKEEGAKVREEIIKLIAKSDNGVLALKLNEDNFLTQEKVCLAVAPLRATGWSVGIILPEKESTAEIWIMGRNLLILTLAGFLVLAVLFLFVLMKAAKKDSIIETDEKRKKVTEDSLPDVTELVLALKEKQDALEAAHLQLIESERMASIGQLTAGIAHEIKNPLNFVNNFALLTVSLANELNEELEKISEKLSENDKEYLLEITGDIQSNAQKINEHGKRAESIVKGMLLQSRGKSGEFQLTDVNALLAEYVNLGYHGMRAQDSNFNIKIDAEYDQSIGKVMVIPQNLSRVFLNIINNACYATNEKKIQLKDAYNPVLTVHTKNFDEHFEIHIHDNGKGIPQTVIDKVFNPFYTTKPPGQGTGLGLSLSYNIIVKEHHGSMKVESVEDEFAEFIISIPKNLH
jgi:signal transduction histidine kinase